METFKFPNGFEFHACRKKDILDEIDDSVDKDVLETIIDTLEADAREFLVEKQLAGIPYLGSIGISEAKKLRKSEEIQQLIRDGKEVLTKEEYKVFRLKLNAETKHHAAQKRYFAYAVGTYIKQNRGFYEFLLQNHDEKAAQLICYTSRIFTLEDQYNTYHGTE